jgi:hypothetical protein
MVSAVTVHHSKEEQLSRGTFDSFLAGEDGARVRVFNGVVCSDAGGGIHPCAAADIAVLLPCVLGDASVNGVFGEKGKCARLHDWATVRPADADAEVKGLLDGRAACVVEIADRRAADEDGSAGERLPGAPEHTSAGAGGERVGVGVVGGERTVEGYEVCAADGVRL